MSETFFQKLGGSIATQAPQAFFVGGCVRDLLLGVPIKDVDLALPGDPSGIARGIARTYGGHVFYLREEDQVVRVLLPEREGLQLDFSPLRGSLEEDLRARDLTINAMAVPAAAGLYRGVEVIDPTGGRDDLAARLVRFTSPAAPEQDPLRTLRALRFRWKLGFELAPGVEDRIRACAPLLARVSAERIRDELFQLLALPEAADALRECLDAGLGRWLVRRDVELGCEEGEPAPALGVRRVLAVLREAGPGVESFLSAEITPPRRRREILLWAAALQPLMSAAEAGQSARALALSGDERQLIVSTLLGAGTAREAVERWPVPGRIRLRLFQRAGRAGPEAVLLAAALEGWDSRFQELLEEALRRQYWPEPPLLSGFEVMQITGVGRGPKIGQVLQEVEEARADGLVRTPAEAADWLRERVQRGELK